MPLHPEARALLRRFEALGDPPLETTTPEAARALRASRIQPPTIALPEIRDLDAGASRHACTVRAPRRLSACSSTSTAAGGYSAASTRTTTSPGRSPPRAAAPSSRPTTGSRRSTPFPRDWRTPSRSPPGRTRTRERSAAIRTAWPSAGTRPEGISRRSSRRAGVSRSGSSSSSIRSPTRGVGRRRTRSSPTGSG